MKNEGSYRTVGWLLGLMMLVGVGMLMACSGNDETEPEQQPTVLTVYVYPPQKPIVTRAGGVEGTEAEYAVTRLQIWLFEHETGNKVGYLDADVSALNGTEHSAAYDLIMPEWFVVEKPNVDVYVFANVTTANAGVAFGESDSRETLNNATLNNNFGLKSQGGYPMATLPKEGIPMTGVLMNQPVTGEAPRLRIGSGAGMATTQLVRTTSKVMFLFARPAGGPALNISDISIDAGMIPNVEYLVLPAPLTFRVGSDYYASSSKVISASIPVTTSCDSPSEYVMGFEDAQAYNDRIMNAIEEGKLTAKGPYYLRESDKQITGTLTYQVGSESAKTAAFSMSRAGDFARNHSWIVYAYYTAGDMLTITSVAVDDWIETPDIEHIVVNW